MQLVDTLLESVSARDEMITNVLVGLHWIGVESRFAAGMAHVPKGGECIALKDAGNILGRSSREIAARLKSWVPLDACLGLAALCSLIDPVGDPVNVNDYIVSCAPGTVVTCGLILALRLLPVFGLWTRKSFYRVLHRESSCSAKLAGFSPSPDSRTESEAFSLLGDVKGETDPDAMVKKRCG